MNGKIIIYCKDVSAGVLQDTAGRKYIFNLSSWMSRHIWPLSGMEVSFNPTRCWATDIWATLVPDIRKQALSLPLKAMAY